MLHAFEQRANAASSLVGHRPVSFEREGEFFVLGADAELRLRLDALSDPIDEIVAPLDRRQVDLITRHGIPEEWAAAFDNIGDDRQAALRFSGGKRP